MHTDSRRVWEVHRERMSPGNYTWYWNESHAPPGNYILIMQTDEVPMVIKFTLLK
jgi:hypothetical protein